MPEISSEEILIRISPMLTYRYLHCGQPLLHCPRCRADFTRDECPDDVCILTSDFAVGSCLDHNGYL